MSPPNGGGNKLGPATGFVIGMVVAFAIWSVILWLVL